MSNAKVGVHKYFLRSELLVALYFVQNMNCEIFEIRQDFYPNMLGIIPDQFANRDVVTLFLVHLDVLVAPKPDKISRKKVYSYRSIAQRGTSSIERSSREIGSRPESLCVILAEDRRDIYYGSRGEISDRVAQRQGRWNSDAYKVYTVNNIEDSRRVSRILGDKRRTVSRQPGDGDVWGVTREVANSNVVKTPRPRYG